MLDKGQLLANLPRLRGARVLIVGDLVLDHYVIGSVGRISPEAPVPVVHVREERHLLGGAGNVARNVVSLGGEAVVVGVCGDDPDGRLMGRLLEDNGVAARTVCDPGRPTIRKTRIVAQNQQVVRVDYEQTHELDQDAEDRIFDALRAEAPACGVVVVSDYGKGLVTARFMDRLHALLAQLPARPKVYVDPKVRNFELYKGVDILTPNTKEAAEGAGLPVEDRTSVLRAGARIFRKLGCANLLITLGPDGMALFESPDSVLHIPTAARKVFDVTGAGDTVIAALALGTAAGFDLAQACAVANIAAGIVVGEVGTAAATLEQVEHNLRAENTIPLERWFGPGD
ncbi:D-glycero-beta-D-manno-heptose-7-phosphate kinase [Desulfocurvus sp.]|jgi:rfaE bifunctional protein kinase chain/domain|uniref:D-glycero-beta-D-manno-heptose-7-phosphate kinase n=1 Tax=Desulfocurvus sp. TaxID=2871698 RepID=UPI0025C223EC|nr:D-glycero-beta-D-manno-heptose-7-phosphate kinase [Desulfocurvus sp.]MCK9240873.1 D-glycero-beta-D-manno-heptose-7-phosphate kinase [Desulfocurvus sp.]